jgi:predicted nucleic acid-binding protein
LNYTKEDAHLSAKIELEAEGAGRAVRRTDAMIAAVTINKGARIYTLDLKHFGPLKAHGLRLFPRIEACLWTPRSGPCR